MAKPGSRRAWADEDKAAIWRLYCEGVRPQAIAERTGLAYSRVAAALGNMRGGHLRLPESVAHLRPERIATGRDARERAACAEIWRRYCGAHTIASIGAAMRQMGLMDRASESTVASLIRRMRTGTLPVPAPVAHLRPPSPLTRRYPGGQRPRLPAPPAPRPTIEAEPEPAPAPAPEPVLVRCEAKRLPVSDRRHLAALLRAEPREARAARRALLFKALRRAGYAA